jgi:hypothetical protein
MRVIDRLRRSDVVIPVGLWLVAFVVARAAGFAMTMPWIFYQVLDAPVLAEHPLASLCYLHSQPPVLNALVAACLTDGLAGNRFRFATSSSGWWAHAAARARG